MINSSGPSEAYLAAALAAKKWRSIYPVYLNSKRTIAEGRRLKKEKCIPDPTCQEIKDILDNAGLRTFYDPRRMYARDSNRDMLYQGRIKVELVNDSGTVVNEKFPHKLAVLHYLGESIPKLKSRIASGSQSSSASGSAAQGSSSNKGKQKGKGGKRK